ncbi:hypothetical protein M422DRAFT_260669 [Sphaerobolus stellatus SS14]|uniref:Uncharacterized protein n=1 Tax=Sphaerobolus stellatus (strain SS14) TaxID=990650 RepID=A0A0C9U1Y3_SPHS4|nr:hypothetical protein M422DRAFT_260669 [Sphaerobolus stellatus SS14]
MAQNIYFIVYKLHFVFNENSASACGPTQGQQSTAHTTQASTHHLYFRIITEDLPPRKYDIALDNTAALPDNLNGVPGPVDLQTIFPVDVKLCRRRGSAKRTLPLKLMSCV